jgi:phenylacetate-coenzyme A ligase PaaK-like adenylate-forming protein
MELPFSSFPEIQWPAVPSPYAAGLFSVLWQLERTQWWTADELAAYRERQLSIVLRHAQETVPFYRQRFDAASLTSETAASPEGWLRIPLLTRRDIQTAGESLYSTRVPATHGTVKASMTSGSTGEPVVVRTTDLTKFFWRVLTLRDHYWHRCDFSQSLAAIRYTGDDRGKPPLGMQLDNWGPAFENTIPTGPGHLLNVQSSVEEQADWLNRINPSYVLGYPSALLGIAELFAVRGWHLSNLRHIRTFGEILELRCREACQRIFNVKVVDMYSSQEVGYIALQCPEQDHYHVQSESLLVEVLDDAGRQCQPGQIGRIVITTLHNFAMPLLRYDIGDSAEVGEKCPCGRGLPVLKRILGRQRNLLVLPNGERRWPLFAEGHGLGQLPLFYQFQVVQRNLEEIEVNAVRDAPLTPGEEDVVKKYFQQTLGHPFRITINCVDSIPRNRTGKFEDFISYVE